MPPSSRTKRSACSSSWWAAPSHAITKPTLPRPSKISEEMRRTMTRSHQSRSRKKGVKTTAAEKKKRKSRSSKGRGKGGKGKGNKRKAGEDAEDDGDDEEKDEPNEDWVAWQLALTFYNQWQSVETVAVSLIDVRDWLLTLIPFISLFFRTIDPIPMEIAFPTDDGEDDAEQEDDEEEDSVWVSGLKTPASKYSITFKCQWHNQDKQWANSKTTFIWALTHNSSSTPCNSWPWTCIWHFGKLGVGAHWNPIELSVIIVKSWNLRPCGISSNKVLIKLELKSLEGPPELIWPAGSQSCNPTTFAPVRMLTSSWRSATPDKNVRRHSHGCSTSWLFDATMTTHKKCFWFSAAASVARLGPKTTVSCQLKKVLNCQLFINILLLIYILEGIVIQCHCHGTFTNNSKRSWIVSCLLTFCF